MNDIKAGDRVLVTPLENHASLHGRKEFMARVINAYSHALVVKSDDGNYFDVMWEEVEKIED